MKIRTSKLLATATATLAFSATHSFAATQVGGADMFPGKNIIENAVASPIHKTLVAAVKAAGLVETLSGAGPFLVFAPTDAAFAALPDGTVETLLKPENKDQLTKILTCHVVASDALYGTIRALIRENGGTHEVETLGGCVLQAKMNGHRLTITDENGTLARVVVPDVVQSNGMIHVIDGVILPASGDAAMDDNSSMEKSMDDEAADDSSMEESMDDGMADNSALEDDMDKEMADDSAMEESTDEEMAEETASEEDMGQGDMDNDMSEDMAKGDSETTEADGDMSEENTNPSVGGAPMFADRTIVDNAAASPIHTTLVDAVIAADLAGTLSDEGPFTVFAPVDAAFAALPEGTVDTLLMAENKDQLTKILTCHVVAADVMSDALVGMIESGGGTADVETVGGCMLKASVIDGKVMIEDEQGGMATVTVADVKQSNGVIHVVDRVLLPAM